jgi:hypothetical protein
MHVMETDHFTYSVGHNVILSHAHAVQVYRKEFKLEQKGVIGM